MKTRRFFLFQLGLTAVLFPAALYAIGAAQDTEWPAAARLEVQLKLTARPDKDKEGRPQVGGELIITNPTDSPLTIQSPANRLGLAFFVSDELGNPVAPQGLAKVDPSFETVSLAPHATYTHYFEALEYVTGSILRSYELNAGKTYRVIAVYRAAGPHGPGFTSAETPITIPR